MFYGILAVVAVLIVVLDQVSKYLVLANIPLGGEIPVWPGVFHLTHIRNTGMAFSLLEGGRWFFLIMTLAAFVLMAVAIRKKWINHPTGLWALAWIAGGAVGNLIDRVRWGYVVDMLETEFMEFPVFNVADCFITCGCIALMVSLIFFNKKFWKDEKHGTDR